MPKLSRPFESLIKPGTASGCQVHAVDYLVIGSGYGGAVAALRLAGESRKVAVLERGKEYGLGDFPYDIEDLPSHVRLSRGAAPSGYADALFDIRSGEQTDVLVGSGLGGTSLINANVAEEPAAHVFKKPAWPDEFSQAEQPLQQEFAAVRSLLGVAKHGAATNTEADKYRALGQLGKAIGHEAEKASIAVSFDAGPNAVGVQQNPCTDCGNCVTGCNVGAKNTLDRNLIPLAKSRGAEFFTGVTTESIEPSDDAEYRYKVWVTLTAPTAGTVEPESFCVAANHVILAAGTLGSTEILLRSRKAGHLALSDRLGEHFSTNGDGLIMSYGQSERVNAIASAEQKAPAEDDRIGPTITGIIRTPAGAVGAGSLTIEEASVPAGLSAIFAELVTSSAMLQRLANRRLPPYLREQGLDPLAASEAVASHCQALLVMGDDGAAGKLSLVSTGEKTTGLHIDFPDARDNAALCSANTLIKAQDRKPGLGLGQYAPNPLWELLPEEAGSVLGGELPQGRAITVHPLGGCGMGNSAALGVVNARGQVFDPASGGVHEGLFVCDGAVIPAALEINPFLTIAALAWRISGAILKDSDQPESALNQVVSDYAQLAPVPERRQGTATPLQIDVREQLVGQLHGAPDWLAQGLASEQREPWRLRVQQTDGLVAQVEARIEDGRDWLNNPGGRALPATMKLYANPLSEKHVARYRPNGVVPSHLAMCEPFLEAQGSFTIFPEDKTGCLRDWWRGAVAVYSYWRRRGFSGLFSGSGGGTGTNNDSPGIRGRLRQLCIFFNVGVLQGRYRRMLYTFVAPDGTVISGEKVLGYSIFLRRMWPALLNLDIEVTRPGQAPVAGSLVVNAEHLMDPGLLQVKQAPHLPASLMFAMGMAGFFVRSLLTSSFWELAGIDYPTKTVTQKTTPQPIKVGQAHVNPWMTTLTVPLRAGSEHAAPLLLTRYQQQRTDAEPVLLLHGLAQGSQVFWSDCIEHNLASFLYEKGYDVWLLDYRLSNHVLPGLADTNWSMDEIAEFDIPAAIDYVFAATGKPVKIFSHCVGSCTVAMAVLAGHVAPGRISALIANAIHPWVITSPNNRLRAKLAGLFREGVETDNLNPIPGPEDGVLQNVMDRVAYGLSRTLELEGDDHREFGAAALSDAICDRMSFLYGRMWNHSNIPVALHNNFVNMFGPAPAAVYRHMYYYSVTRRITDSKGDNRYLRGKNITDNWRFPTLFVHGEDSRVFSPFSAERSAIRLRKLLVSEHGDKAPAISHERFPGQGHMDVVFGSAAKDLCYDKYHAFFERQRPADDPDAIDHARTPFIAHPRTGPFLRAAWLDDDGKIRLRFWAELKTNAVRRAEKIVVSVTDGKELDALSQDAIKWPQQGVKPRPRYRYVDIALEEMQAAVELVFKGDVAGYKNEPGIKLALDKQAWLLRLRARASGSTIAGMSFLVGSCRFPGSVLDRDLSDKVYGAMFEHVNGADGVHMLFLLGDQIYADATDQVFEIKTLKTRYTDRYYEAFDRRSSPRLAKLLQQLPTHFALDDHELDDNWSGLAAPTNDKQRYQYQEQERQRQFAVASAARFQGSARNQEAVGKTSYVSPFYYALDHNGECEFPGIVLDTRTEREFRASANPSLYNLMGMEGEGAQFEVLKSWLAAAARDYPEQPKFIYSGSIVTPLSRDYVHAPQTWRSQDGWAGYPATLEKLLGFIVDEGIQKVVFVGGDAHLSAVARLQLDNGVQQCVAWQIVSSGLYAPLPFANSQVKDFDWEVAQSLPVHTRKDLRVNCINYLLSDHLSQFVRVDATEDAVQVQCFDENQQPLQSKRLDLVKNVVS